MSQAVRTDWEPCTEWGTEVHVMLILASSKDGKDLVKELYTIGGLGVVLRS